MSGYLKVTHPSGLIGDNPISMFKGILIFMHLEDVALKNIPHFYAQYEDQYVVLSLPEVQIIRGDLPRNRLILVEAWVELHRDELMANWMIIQEGERPYPLAPLG